MNGIDDPNPAGLSLTSVSIEAFRGIRNLSLEGLGRVNLLVGSGNSGKTSILEGLAIFANPFSMSHWMTVARSREVRVGFFSPERMHSADHLRWLFPHVADTSADHDIHEPIIMSATGRTIIREVNASCDFVQGTVARTVGSVLTEDGEEEASVEFVESEGWAFDINGRTSDGERHQLASTIWYSAPNPSQSLKSVPQLSVEYLAPYAHRNQPLQVRGLTDAIMNNEKTAIVDLIRDLDKNIIDIEIISDRAGTRPMIALRHKSAGIVPLTMFGDGVRRALMMALAVLRSRNGILLVDEIEAALHTKALGMVFPWLSRACHAESVQLIATTHSLEAIDSISECSNEHEGDTTAFQLHSDSAQPPRRFSSSMLHRLVHERGLDIR